MNTCITWYALIKDKVQSGLRMRTYESPAVI